MECESIPSCAEMGYTQDSCSGGKGVRCPFDESKFYCAGVKQLPDAENPGVTDENWSAECADKINYCTAYNTECQCTACEDTYLISDGACVPECDKSADTCAAESKVFNAETCTCEACPENYQFNSETKACEQIACDTTKVEHCATYDSEYEPCNCQTCETNYLLVDGICKKMCTVVDNCTAYDSEYDPCNCTACEDGLTLSNGKCVSDCAEKCKVAYPLFAGQANTKATIDQLGNNASAAYAVYAASQFYVGDKNGDFGQGKWYLPSIGEWMYLYGTDVTKMTAGKGATGSVGENKSLIDNALNTLSSKGVNAEGLNESYWSSSEAGSSGAAWLFSTKNGDRSYNRKNASSNALRCFLFLKDCFNPSTGGTAPQIGDVMYSDKTYGSVADYDGSKTPVGIVSSVSKNGRDVTIINLKDLTFGRLNTSFNPDNPYGGLIKKIAWSSGYAGAKNIKGIQDLDEDQLLSMAQASDNCPCQFYLSKVEDSCTGANKCKDASGNCITCYSSCSAYNSNYKDSEPSGYTCSSTTIMIGAGNGATATSKDCYYDCTKDCSGANQCLYNTYCVECYPSCSDFSSTYSYEEQPSGAICTSAYTKIGSGYGAEAVNKPCYGYCATCETACSIYAGSANTKAAIDQIGRKALAAYAASQFYVDNKNGVFGQGKWYLPAIGEWMEFYGTDIKQAAETNHAGGGKGVIGDNMALINAALNTLAGNGVEAEAIGVGDTQYNYNRYWSSTELSAGLAYFLEGNTGKRGASSKNNAYSVRFALILKNAFTGSGTAPKIGDVMYSDRSYGSASGYDSNKTPVGIIASISEDGRDVKIINLKNLTFSSVSSTGNFDPENPCGAYRKVTHWSTSLNTNITGIQDLEDGVALNAFKLLALGNCSCSKYPCNLDTVTCVTENKTFNSANCACEACPNNQTFDEEGKFCRTCEGKQKEGTCAVGENFIEWSKYEDGTACGDCVNCLDETSQNNPCVKEGIYKYTCQGGGRYPIGESKCECGTVPYYTKCGIEEQCFEKTFATKQENGGSCKHKVLEDSTYITKNGYYPVRYDCTRNTDAKKVYWVAECDTPKDCDGNHGPAYGLKTCDEGTGIGEPFMCGGKKWYESCDPCQESYSIRANGGVCYEAALEGSYYDDANGMYRAGEKCTRADGKKVYYIAKCNIEKDCMGNPGLVAGLQDCRSINSEGVGDPVECRGRNFYESCDTCRSFEIKENTDNGGLCDIYTEEGGAHDNGYGHYRVKEKCTQTTGKKVYWVAECNVAKDCAGHVPEAAGLKECASGEFGYGKVVQCGNRIYADKCLAACNYEKTEADCTSEGKSFVVKCVDNKNQSWGECS